MFTTKDTSCDCGRCQAMCSVSCMFTPDEAMKMADSGLGSKLVVCSAQYSDINRGQVVPVIAGKRKDGHCIFFDGMHCTLHTTGLKPEQGVTVMHGMTMEQTHAIQKKVVHLWATPQAQGIVQTWSRVYA